MSIVTSSGLGVQTVVVVRAIDVGSTVLVDEAE